jgi:hypothetical protein
MDVLPVAIAQAIIAAVFIAAWGIVPYIVFWIWPLMAATAVRKAPFGRRALPAPPRPGTRGRLPLLRGNRGTGHPQRGRDALRTAIHDQGELLLSPRAPSVAPGCPTSFLPVAYDRLRLHLNEPIETGYLVKLAEFVRDREPVPAPPSGVGV